MRYINIIIYLLLFTVTESQNLVPNPSFELHSSCPGASGQISFVNSWTGPGTNNTPDYYNACATNTAYSVPYRHIYDYQDASSGTAFVGIWTFSTLGLSRETIQSQLTQTLSLNSYYYFKMKINLHNYARFAINNIGAIITTNTTVPLYNSNINATSVLYKYNNPIITDTLNWINIEAIYKAFGGEKYLSIGNFFNDNYTDTISVSSQYPYSYYFIDDVSVESICTPFWSYRDTTVTLGDSVLIGPAITGLNINWYDINNNFIANAPAIYVKPNSPTYYIASEDFCSGITTHTINVMVTPTSVKEYNAFTNSISLFPNPTTNNFTISNLAESSKLKVDITDTQGKLYSTELITITNNKATIKTNLPSGVYFVSITDNNSGLKAVKKLIVQK